jgi:HEAT repeat protein
VSALIVLVVIAIAQGAFLAVVAVFILARRSRLRVMQVFLAPRLADARAALREWVAGTGELPRVIEAMRRLPRSNALEFAAGVTATALGPDAHEDFARALQDEPWYRHTLAFAGSRQWWQRRQAARALAVAGAPADRATLVRLLHDPEPAVAVLALSALDRVPDPALVGDVLDRYPDLPPVIRRFVLRALVAVRTAVEPALVARIAGPSAPVARAAWIHLAVELNVTHALIEAARHATDPDPTVREAAARALGSLPSAASLDALTRLVIDPVEGVRAAAARSVGRLGSVRGTDILEPALRDPVWAVRYAAAIAMAQLGERGRGILLALRDDADRYVAEIATVVSGLSDGALFELSVD